MPVDQRTTEEPSWLGLQQRLLATIEALFARVQPSGKRHYTILETPAYRVHRRVLTRCGSLVPNVVSSIHGMWAVSVR